MLTCNVLVLIIAAIFMERFAKWELMVPVMVSSVLSLEKYSSLVAVIPANWFCKPYPPWLAVIVLD